MPTYSIERFYSIRQAHSPTFSPDGQRVAFLSNITGVPQVWQVGASGGWPDQLTLHGERVGDAEYSPTADTLLFAMDTGGNEHHQLYTLADGGAREESLGEYPKAMHHFGGWSRDGRQICFAANRRHPQFFDVYVRDVTTGEERMLVEGDAVLSAAGFTPDGRAALYARANSNMDNDLYLVELATGERRHLTPHSGEARYGSPEVTPDGRSLFLVTDQGREFDALCRLDLGSGELTAVAAPNSDVQRCALSRGGRWLAYIVNVEGTSELHLLEAQTGEEHGLSAPRRLPAGVISQLEWAPDSRRLALVVDAADHPMDLWLLDTAQDTATQLTHSPLAGISRQTFVRPQLVRCRSFDGLEVPAWLYVPHGARADGSLPAVMHVHGGPEGQARPVFSKVTQYLINHGYVVLQPNVRGSTGYGRRYTHLDDRQRRFDSVADLKALWEWLVNSSWAHPRRIAVMGGSYGGFMVLAAVTTYPDLWAAGVDIVGIANFATFLEHTHPHRRYLRESEYGSLAEDREWFRQVSPIYHVEKIQAAMMVIHGANDPRVPIGEAEQIVGRLRELGRLVEFLRFEDEGHGVVRIPNQIKAYGAIHAFLDRNVKHRHA